MSLGFATAVLGIGFAAPAASADICGVVGLVNGVAGKACTVATHGAKLLKAGKKLVTGHVGGAVRTVLGGGSSTVSNAIGLAGLGVWVTGGAEVALHETSKVLGETTSPQLTSTWFSATYWRMAGIAAVLTMPFLFAAAVQALVRSDLALLARAAFGYLPLSMLAVSIAAPLTMLLLAGSDQMSAIVGSAAGNGGARFLDHAAGAIGALTLLSGSPFLAFLVGLFTAAGALVLWLELLMRETAVYVIVLMLPLVFAAFVWPARRVWATRAIELLVALILSKFAIVAVLALGGAALSQSTDSLTGSLGGIVLLLMGAFAPWALLRLIPLSELASGAIGSLRAEGRAIGAAASAADAGASAAHARWGEDWATGLIAGMRRQADETPEPAESRDGAESSDNGRVAELAEISAAAGRVPRASNGASHAGAGASGAEAGASASRDGTGGPDGGVAGPEEAAAHPDNGAQATGREGVPATGREGAAPAGTSQSARRDARAPTRPGADLGEPPVDPVTPPAADAQAQPDPGIGPLLQAPNGGWRELYLGPGDGRPQPPLWPLESSDGSAAEAGGTADDPDPRPPAQEPGEGPL